MFLSKPFSSSAEELFFKSLFINYHSFLQYVTIETTSSDLENDVLDKNFLSKRNKTQLSPKLKLLRALTRILE